MIKPDKNLSLIFAFVATLAAILIFRASQDDSRIKALNVFRAPLKIISGAYYALQDVSNFSEIRNENRVLKDSIKNLEMEVLRLQEARLENERLRKLLDFREEKTRKFVPALVIARDPSELTHTIIIDKGKKDKIVKDMLVISGGGLVGRVRETGWSISRVLLITDYDSAFSAMVERTRDSGAVKGVMREGLVMKYLELDCDVQKGDKVVTSGLSGVFEKGVLIGDVVSVEKDPGGLYLNAKIRPEVDIMKLEEVLVMR